MKRRTVGLLTIILFAAVVVVLGWRHWHHGKIFPTTDNAYVGGDVSTVASRIPGTIQDVLVQENEQVNAGQVLFHLDPRDYDQAVVESDARVAKANATLALDRAGVAKARADIAAAESEEELSHADRERYAELSARGSVPQHRYSEVKTAAEVAEARLEAARKGLAAAKAMLEVSRRELQKAQAEHDTAILKRSYCTVVAPCSGMLADKSAQAGQVVAVGQPLCQIVPLDAGHLWVDANFKETQLHRIRPGDAASIRVDSDKGYELKGKVEALSAGTGAAFSLLPPENASGNWVKVVQRLPVRIALDERVWRDAACGWDCQRSSPWIPVSSRRDDERPAGQQVSHRGHRDAGDSDGGDRHFGPPTWPCPTCRGPSPRARTRSRGCSPRTWSPMR